jgi:exonuclease III
MIKLVSINIEADKHLHLVLPFLQKECPDVCAVQEILEEHLPLVSKETGMSLVRFCPMALQPSFLDKSGPKDKKWGVAIFSRLPVIDSGERVYVGARDQIPVFAKAEDEMSKPNSSNYVLCFAKISDGETIYTIATTHFTWTPLGLSTQYQKEHAQLLFAALDSIGNELVLCGDMNAPRGYGTWELFTERYTDTIPSKYRTSIYAPLHRVGNTKKEELADKMVDGLFVTKEYSAHDVRLEEGVSDHMAIVAMLEKQAHIESSYAKTIDTTSA